MKRLVMTSVMTASMLLVGSLANAATIWIRYDGGSANATNGWWQNPTATGSGGCSPQISGGGHEVSWGDGNGGSSGCGDQSSYEYDPRSGAFSVQTGTAFWFGEFEHENEPVTGRTLTSVELDLRFRLGTTQTGGTTYQLNLNPYLFQHDETTNPQGDYVTIVPGSPQAFTFNGVNYLFTFLGFSSAGDYDLYTRENHEQDKKLWAIITEAPTNTVPEPTSMLLMGAALVFAGSRFRRR